MLSALAAVASTLALLLTGAMAGVFYAFSVSVMPGLNAVAAETAVTTMRSVNQKILNPMFFVTFLGPPIASATCGGLLLGLDQPRPATIFFLAAAAYVAGSFVPTAAVNVPLNNALLRSAEPAEAAWAAYSVRWTRWNTLRAVASTVSLALVGLGIADWADG
jgi:uncharacterized membrane protein